MKIKSTLLTTVFLGSLPVFAGTPAPTEPLTPATPSPWSCRVAIYGWAEGLDGDMGVLGRVAPVSIDFSEILDHLDMAAMGAVEIGYNRWSFLCEADGYPAWVPPVRHKKN
jgi:hypothetical protein